MIKLERLGVVLAPPTPETRTTAKYNAGMALSGDTVHMVFRYSEWRTRFDPARQSNYARDEIRYARLSPDGRLLYESDHALLAPSEPWDISGCQDARLIPFEGAYILVYTGWDKDAVPAGQDTARVCLARTMDFVTAQKLGVVTHEGWDKDAFIFPERIGGKIALVHRVEPNIQIDYFDSFEELLDPHAWQGYLERVEASTALRAAFPWECGKVGGSVPPIKTPQGWLFIYHAVEVSPDRPAVYRAGAALLDLADPRRVIARLPYPILEPEMDYERVGDVNHVVFPAGGYVHQGYLTISYGGADRVVALARVPLQDLLEELARYPL